MALEQHIRHAPGTKSADVMLYALSTCGWCHKTKGLLDDLAIEYDYVYIDQLDSETKKEALNRVRALNPKTTFPTMVVNGRAIIGHHEDELREALLSGHG